MNRNPNPWPVFLALATGGFAIGTTEFASMSMVPFIQNSLHIGKAGAGYLISAYALGVVVGAPIITVLAARVPRKPLLLGLMVVFALGNTLSAIAPSYGWLCGFRFVSGLPHGAYFGLAALVAVSVVRPDQYARAVGIVMLGLTLSTIIGVPAATWLGHWIGWRITYGVVSVVAITAIGLIGWFVPFTGAASGAHPLRELGALRRIDVWLTLAIGAVGFGGIFSVYTYLTSTLGQVTGVAEVWMPVVLAVFGIGMTVGNLVVPRFADRERMLTVGATLAASAVFMGVFYIAAFNVVAVVLDVFAIGFCTALATVLQTRLMDVAGDSQNLAAAMNHVAFNVANALGPFLAGLALERGFSLPFTGPVGTILALFGLAFWFGAYRRDRRAPVTQTRG